MDCQAPQWPHQVNGLVLQGRPDQVLRDGQEAVKLSMCTQDRIRNELPMNQRETLTTKIN